MPTIFRYKSYRFFFNSHEETRQHIHIETVDGTAKFWLEPIVSLAICHNLDGRVILELENIVKEKQDEFFMRWNRHFGV